MQNFKDEISKLSKEYEELEKHLDLEGLKQKIKKIEAQSTEPGFWENKALATKTMQEMGELTKEYEEIGNLKTSIKNLGVFKGKEAKLIREIKKARKKLENLKLKTMLSGPYDRKDALLSIHAGQGGTEAMDWTQMMQRMYIRYSERRGFKVDIVDLSFGEEAGIKSTTLSIGGAYAYGFLKGEAGTHRLVRQSPFNADKLRHTSFALVGVLPKLDEVDIPDINIRDEDLDWQFFRASTQGGQNVQKVSTAVRLKHIPTQITVTAQTQRFQEQNRKIALSLLRAKLWALEEEKKEREVKSIKGDYKPASWGNQIRSYVLHPYKMVKDLRTKVEVSDTDGVLDGDIDQFIEAQLRLKLRKN